MTVTQTSWPPTTAATLRIPVQGRAPKPELTDRSTMLTIPEVAAACRISQTSVRRAIAEGELEAVKLRSRIRITREAFDTWLANQQRPATRPKPGPAAPRPRANRPKKPPSVFPPPGSFRELSRAGLDRDAA
jgi:excisionase family DNA binding protein